MENKYLQQHINTDFHEFNKFIYSNGIDTFELSCVIAAGDEIKNTIKAVFFNKNSVSCNKIFFNNFNEIFGLSESKFNQISIKKNKLIFCDKNSINFDEIYKNCLLFKNIIITQYNGMFYFLGNQNNKKIYTNNFSEIIQYKLGKNSVRIKNNISE